MATKLKQQAGKRADRHGRVAGGHLQLQLNDSGNEEGHGGKKAPDSDALERLHQQVAPGVN
jgi:hypothetical protein